MVKRSHKGINKTGVKTNSNVNVNKTKYQAALSVWDERIGQGKKQLSNWRLCAVLSFFMVVLLVVALILVVGSRNTKVYVAQVGPEDNLQRVDLVGVSVAATELQKIYFISQFLRNIMEISLDPVLVRGDWVKAYKMSAGNAQLALTSLVRDTRPFSQIGEVTKSVKIGHINPVGNNSFEVVWTQQTINYNGKVVNTSRYNGVFTVEQLQPSDDLSELMINPFGLKIIYFSINKLGGVGR